MKKGTLCGILISRVGRRLCAMIALACVLACAGLSAQAGNIFDDDWTPPKPAVRPHVVPAPPGPVAPTPAPTDPHPAAAPTTTGQPAITPPATAQPAAEARPQAPSRHAIPGKMEQAHSRGLLKEAFAAQLKDRTIAGRRKLAQALLDEVPKTADNPSDEFVLLGGAIDASKEGAVLRLCFAAADTMAAQYEVDGLSVKTEAALKVNLRGDSPATAADNVKAALELVDPLVASEDFTTALRILTLARPAAAGDSSLLSVVQKRIAAVESLRAAHDRLAQQLQKLQAAPDDPAANLAAGSYFCFNRGEWERGLPMLAKASDANLKKLAALELSHPAAPDDVMRLGDGWWDLGAKQPDIIRGEIYQHAASFYQTALPGVTGLRRTMMEHRIAEAGTDQTATRQTSAALQRTGPEVFTNSIGMKFVRIKPGTFTMGSPADEEGHQGYETQHEVTLTRTVYMGAYDVTRGQFAAFVTDSGYKMTDNTWRKTPGMEQTDNHPVVAVSWNDAVAFTQWLSHKERRTYRLPTEAEWEYACRAGTTTPFNTGATITTDQANFNGEQPYGGGAKGVWRRGTTPVGSFPPNKWGLYDMHGNVLQWCYDVNALYPDGPATDPTGPEQSPERPRVQRGGSRSGGATSCRSACRSNYAPDSRRDIVGFRIVLVPPGEQATEVTKPAPPVRLDHNAFTNSIGMKFVRIEPGIFMMGSAPSEQGRAENETLHHVKITKAFLMATTPVTQAQWKTIMGKNPSHVQGDDNPVETVSWEDAVAFCEKLSVKERAHYRLPTEAEWEYACRAGTSTPYGGTNNLDEMGWYLDNCNKQTHPVAQKKPNAWGLYDMHGNVWQWCSDAYGPYDGEATDPQGGNDTTSRINRGGSWYEGASRCRAAFRKWNKPRGWDGRIGFRVVVDIPGEHAAAAVRPAPPARAVLDAAGFTNSIGMKLVRIEPGTFIMGSPPSEAGRQDNETLHRVRITRPFLMATTLVTQAQWKAIMGGNPSKFQGDDHPVDKTIWKDIVTFCEKLSAKEGKHYRVPTEAEWEYACRAGTQTAFGFADGSLEDYAWFDANSGQQPHDVATKKPNRWGLYDMQGNMCQRCSDGYGPYDGDSIDPKGSKSASMRVMRGGSWQRGPAECRAAWRGKVAPNDQFGDVGFRVCMDF